MADPMESSSAVLNLIGTFNWNKLIHSNGAKTKLSGSTKCGLAKIIIILFKSRKETATKKMTLCEILGFMECDRCSAEIFHENESNPMLNFEFEADTNESPISKPNATPFFDQICSVFTHTHKIHVSNWYYRYCCCKVNVVVSHHENCFFLFYRLYGHWQSFSISQSCPFDCKIYLHTKSTTTRPSLWSRK